MEKEKPKRKYRIILAVLIVLGIIGLVSALTIIYIYQPSNINFTKNLTVNQIDHSGGGQEGSVNKYVHILTTGDISNSIINCNLDNTPCNESTGLINLSNDDPINSHNCTIETTGDSNVTVNLIGITSPVIIPANDTVTFSLNYESNTAGSYPMNTVIDCP